MLQHKGRHRRCKINVVFSLSIAYFNSVVSLATFLFGYMYMGGGTFFKVGGGHKSK